MTYERDFMALMEQRGISEILSPSAFEERSALLCSEPTAEHCHRRLVVQHLAAHWPDVRAIHL